MFERARASDAYLDVHAWRFTPSSFRAIIGDLRRLELTGLTEKGGFLTGGWEFYITLHRGPAPSDQERLPLLKAAMTEWGSLTC
jgi:hypothetical protein